MGTDASKFRQESIFPNYDTKIFNAQFASGGTCRMFPTTGDSMLPIPEGSDVVAGYVQDFVFKQVSLQKNGTVLLRSLNKD